MKCKKCGGNVIDIVEKQMTIITPIGHNERPFGRFLKTVCKKNLVKSCTNKEFFIFLKNILTSTLGFDITDIREGEMPREIELKKKGLLK